MLGFSYRRLNANMMTIRYDARILRQLLHERKVATLPELKEALGTAVDLTVFRKLRELSYRTSYSHRGSFYTLEEIARFDELGLWQFGPAGFSRYGTLVRTCTALVNDSESGYFADELEALVHVTVKDTLRLLVEREQVTREKVEGRYLYLCMDRRIRARQLLNRQAQGRPGSLLRGVRPLGEAADELKAAIVLFTGLLDEKQRRLYAGLESLRLGHGGDQAIGRALGLDPGTVARGRRELMARDVELERVRRPGGGRKALEKERLRSSARSRS